MSVNAVLQKNDELAAACALLKANSPAIPDDAHKCWDEWKAFSFITSFGRPDDVVLDAGTCKCRILEALYNSGYRRLYGCDLAPVEWRRRVYPYLFKPSFGDLVRSLLGSPPIRLSAQDMCRTKYRSAMFDFITSLSVVEHGVGLVDYFREVHRLLKPGGHLITSTDYWPIRIDTGDIKPFGLSWNIFDENTVKEMLSIAGDFRLRLTEPLELDCGEPVIELHGKRYTFLFFILRKEGNG